MLTAAAIAVFLLIVASWVTLGGLSASLWEDGLRVLSRRKR